MASRPHTTYKKRQKELQRLEKQRDKVARRVQRKEEKAPEIPFDPDAVIDPDSIRFDADGFPLNADEIANDPDADPNGRPR